MVFQISHNQTATLHAKAEVTFSLTWMGAAADDDDEYGKYLCMKSEHLHTCICTYTYAVEPSMVDSPREEHSMPCVCAYV